MFVLTAKDLASVGMATSPIACVHVICLMVTGAADAAGLVAAGAAVGAAAGGAVVAAGAVVGLAAGGGVAVGAAGVWHAASNAPTAVNDAHITRASRES